MKKVSIIKAKIKRQKRFERKEYILYLRMLELMFKYNVLCKTNYLSNILFTKVKGKKLKKLKSMVKNWHIKRMILDFGSKNYVE